MAKTFTIDLPSIDLIVDEIWPDGDAPENPTAEDVKKVIQDHGGIVRVLSDWDLLSRNDFEVKAVSVKPWSEIKAAKAEALNRLKDAPESNT